MTSKAKNSAPDAPNLFIIGGAKCGTTTLHDLLRQHPQIFLTVDKEPRFFDADNYYCLGVDAYLNNHFKGSSSYPVRGEATPSYLTHASTSVPRIREAFGKDLSFIVIMRDPVMRAWSHYLHMIRYDSERESFEKALELEAERLRESELAWIGYFNDGLYAHHLKAWFEVFPKERFLLILTEDLAAAPQKTVRQICEFLHIDTNVTIETGARKKLAARPRVRWLGSVLNRPNRVTNTLKLIFPYLLRKVIRDWINVRNTKPYEQAPELDPAVERCLRKRYASDVRRLQEIMGRDLSHWLPDADTSSPGAAADR